MPKKVVCEYCGKTNTELELDEEILKDGDESLIINVYCNDCHKYTPFPYADGEDWRDYK